MKGPKKLTAQQARGVQGVIGCTFPGGDWVELHTAKGRDFKVPIVGVVNDWAERLKWHRQVVEDEKGWTR